MSQKPPQSSNTPALFDPGSVEAYDYERTAVVLLALWCAIGVLMMFSGSGLTDTIGLGMTLAEIGIILVIDRRGFYTAAGVFKVDEWSSFKRGLLAVAEVPGFFIVLITYVIRITMVKFNELPPTRDRR